MLPMKAGRTETKMDQKTLHFGQLLKEIRIKETRLGLRRFANLIEMAPSNLSNIERGKSPPPNSKPKIDSICDALGLGQEDPKRDEFFDLAAKHKDRIPADVAQTIKDNPIIPLLVRTVGNKPLSKDKIEGLAAYLSKF